MRLLRTVDSLREKPAADTKSALSEAIDAMWRKFLPQILERAQVLEDAAKSAAAGNLNEVEREAGKAAAHKLAGTLGTFGLERGTRLARELEHLYSGATLPAERLGKLAAEVRAMIQSRK